MLVVGCVKHAVILTARWFILLSCAGKVVVLIFMHNNVCPVGSNHSINRNETDHFKQHQQPLSVEFDNLWMGK